MLPAECWPRVFLLAILVVAVMRVGEVCWHWNKWKIVYLINLLHNMLHVFVTFLSNWIRNFFNIFKTFSTEFSCKSYFQPCQISLNIPTMFIKYNKIIWQKDTILYIFHCNNISKHMLLLLLLMFYHHFSEKIDKKYGGLCMLCVLRKSLFGCYMIHSAKKQMTILLRAWFYIILYNVDD